MAGPTGRPSCSSLRRSAFMLVTFSHTCGASALVALLSRSRSPPAKKVFLAEVTTTPVMESFSDSRRSTVSWNDVRNRSFIVLADWFRSSMVSGRIPSASACQRNMFSLIFELLSLSRLGLSDAFDDGRGAHAAADAQRHQGPL